MTTTDVRPRRIRLRALRVGYVFLALAFACIGASAYAGALILAAPIFALVGAILLIVSRDPLPRTGGLVLLVYFLALIAFFLASTPVTLRLSGGNYFVNDSPSPALRSAFDAAVSALPLGVGLAILIAIWERESAARLLVWGALAGAVLVLALTILLPSASPGVNATAEQARIASSSAAAAGNLVKALLALTGLCGAAGAAWASARPDEYA